MSRGKTSNAGSDGHSSQMSSFPGILIRPKKVAPTGFLRLSHLSTRMITILANYSSDSVPGGPATDLVKDDPVLHQWNL